MSPGKALAPMPRGRGHTPILQVSHPAFTLRRAVRAAAVCPHGGGDGDPGPHPCCPCPGKGTPGSKLPSAGP